MKSYEAIFIFPPESTPDARKNQLQQLEDSIKKFSGTLSQKTEAGRKLLGYPVKKFREGYVLYADFLMDTSKTNEFRKALELQEDLLKYVIFTKEEKAAKKRPPRRADTKPAASSAVTSSH